jgi:hypothetical protein
MQEARQNNIVMPTNISYYWNMDHPSVPNPSFIPLPVILLCLFALSCSHVAHRAGVEPGMNASLMIGPTLNNYHIGDDVAKDDRPDKYNTDTQVSIGYAWKIKEKKRLMVQWIANGYRPSINGGGDFIPVSTGFDIYYQGSGDSTNAGIGLMIGLDPKLYLMWGKDYRNPASNFRTGLDFGLGFGLNISLIPQLMYTVRYKSLQTSLLMEYRLFGSSYTPCDENCDDEYLKSRFSVGIVFTIDDHK